MQRPLSITGLAVSGGKGWSSFAPARSLVLVAVTISLAAVCLPRGVFGGAAAAGPLGGAFIGVTVGASTLVAILPLYVFAFLTKDLNNAQDNALFLNGLSWRRRATLGLATILGGALVATGASAFAGSVAGLGDAMMAGFRVNWKQIDISAVPLILCALVWQTCFCLGLAIAFPLRRRVLSAAALGYIPVALMLFWLPTELTTRVGAATPAGLVFVHLFKVGGHRYLETSGSYDALILSSWQIAAWLAAIVNVWRRGNDRRHQSLSSAVPPRG